MPSISFLYRIGTDRKVYYGKSDLMYIADDHNGLDEFILNKLLVALNEDRKQRKLFYLSIEDVSIGILGYLDDEKCYTSRNELKFFDFYLYESSLDNFDYYLNGMNISPK